MGAWHLSAITESGFQLSASFQAKKFVFLATHFSSKNRHNLAIRPYLCAAGHGLLFAVFGLLNEKKLVENARRGDGPIQHHLRPFG